MKRKNQIEFKKLALPLVAVLLLISSCAFAYLYIKERSSVPEIKNEIPTKQVPVQKTPTSENSNKETPAPVVIAKQSSGPADCQPESFDPDTDTYTITETGGTPKELYEIEGFDGGMMNINGWVEEGSDKITLNSPYDVDVYHFGCASSTSYVIEIKKNDKRQGLYTNVIDFRFSPDKEYLYIQTSSGSNDNWNIESRIVNIQTEEEKALENINCMDTGSLWQGDRLLTYSIDDYPSDYQTHMCVWDTQSELLSRIDLNTAVAAGSGNSLAEQVGILPSDPDVLYTYTTREDSICSLFLVDIFDNASINYIDIYERDSDDYYCALPHVDFDLSSTSLDDGIVKYRIEQSRDAEGNVEYGEWSEKSVE